MNILSDSPVLTRGSLIWHGTALLFAGLLVGCTTSKEKPGSTFEMPKRIDMTSILVQKSLQEHAQELATAITEKINNNPEFHSLSKIKAYLVSELEKRWISPAIVSAKIVPFMPTEKGSWDYLFIDIKTPLGWINFSLGTDDRDSIVPVLTEMLDSFEREIQERVRKTFLEVIKSNRGEIEVTELEENISAVLENEAHLFLQHGFQYQWLEIGEKEGTGEIEIRLRLYDIPNDKIIDIPVPTGIIPEKRERPRGRSIQGETMLAQWAVDEFEI